VPSKRADEYITCVRSARSMCTTMALSGTCCCMEFQVGDRVRIENLRGEFRQANGHLGTLREYRKDYGFVQEGWPCLGTSHQGVVLERSVPANTWVVHMDEHVRGVSGFAGSNDAEAAWFHHRGFRLLFVDCGYMHKVSHVMLPVEGSVCEPSV
jgi:hypothetical protein